MQQLTFLDDNLIDHYRITTERAVFGLTSVNGRINNPPPIAKWAHNVPTEQVISWYIKKGAQIERTNAAQQPPDPRAGSGEETPRPADASEEGAAP
jgi:hypothetical protein